MQSEREEGDFGGLWTFHSAGEESRVFEGNRGALGQVSTENEGDSEARYGSSFVHVMIQFQSI